MNGFHINDFTQVSLLHQRHTTCRFLWRLHITMSVEPCPHIHVVFMYRVPFFLNPVTEILCMPFVNCMILDVRNAEGEMQICIVWIHTVPENQ